MQSAMQQIADAGMSPVQSTGAAMNTGKTIAGFTLYEAYAVKAQDDVRVKVISSLVTEGLTYAEFDTAVKAAEAHGIAADKLAGWAPADGAKGRDKYGPKQNTMVQRATEMRQIFGYLKQTHADMHAGGYLETLKVAREWLKEKNLKWDGGTKPTQEQVSAEKQTKALAEATKQAMLSVPKVPGESTGDWFARVAKEAQRLVDVDAAKARDDKMQKVVEGLAQSWDISDLYTIGLSLMAHCIREGYADKDSVATDLKDIEAPAPVAE